MRLKTLIKSLFDLKNVNLNNQLYIHILNHSLRAIIPFISIKLFLDTSLSIYAKWLSIEYLGLFLAPVFGLNSNSYLIRNQYHLFKKVGSILLPTFIFSIISGLVSVFYFENKLFSIALSVFILYKTIVPVILTYTQLLIDEKKYHIISISLILIEVLVLASLSQNPFWGRLLSLIVPLLLIFFIYYNHFGIQFFQIINLIRFSKKMMLFTISGLCLTIFPRLLAEYRFSEYEFVLLGIYIQISSILNLYARSVTQYLTPRFILMKKGIPNSNKIEIRNLIITILVFGLLIYIASPLIFKLITSGVLSYDNKLIMLCLLFSFFQATYQLLPEILIIQNKQKTLVQLICLFAIVSLTAHYFISDGAFKMLLVMFVSWIGLCLTLISNIKWYTN